MESEYETVDIMANGQQRFALYDQDGNLKAAASPDLTRAGKPAKCLWCHEINIQKLFLPNDPVAGYYSDDEFDNIIATAKSMIGNYRRGLKSDLSFNKTQQHTQGELLYISFMQPSAYRLSNEWGIAVEEAQNLLGAMPTHPARRVLPSLAICTPVPMSKRSRPTPASPFPTMPGNPRFTSPRLSRRKLAANWLGPAQGTVLKVRL